MSHLDPEESFSLLISRCQDPTRRYDYSTRMPRKTIFGLEMKITLSGPPLSFSKLLPTEGHGLLSYQLSGKEIGP